MTHNIDVLLRDFVCEIVAVSQADRASGGILSTHYLVS